MAEMIPYGLDRTSGGGRPLANGDSLSLPDGTPLDFGKTGQVVHSATAAVVACSTVMPVDTTIPQNTEGTEVLTAAITPKNASSKLFLRFSGFATVSSDELAGIAAAVFVDATADAIYATELGYFERTAGGTTFAPRVRVCFECEIPAGSVAARTYKVRVGPGSAGTVTVNGTSFGGVAQALFTVTEILP